MTPVISPKDATHDYEQRNKVTINASHQPCPTQVASNLECGSELNHIKVALQDLQTQQQKIAVIVSYLHYGNRIQAPDTTNILKDHPSFSFSPYMGLLDTGQYFSKLHQK